MNRLIKDKKPVIKPDDVFLVSYPRSGNSWLRYMLANLFHPTLEWNVNNLNRAIPDLHQQLTDNFIDSHPRIFKSHCSYRGDYSRVIYLYRDGRDVSLSYYDLKKKVRGYKKEFPDFLVEMLKGKLTFGSWQAHINSWLFNQGNTSLLAIQYEQLYNDIAGTIKLVGDFLGFQWGNEEIKSAVNKSSVEKQKKDFYKYKYESHWLKGFQGGVKGGPGKWREVFDRDLNELFWQYTGDVCEKLGYPKY